MKRKDGHSSLPICHLHVYFTWRPWRLAVSLLLPIHAAKQTNHFTPPRLPASILSYLVNYLVLLWHGTRRTLSCVAVELWIPFVLVLYFSITFISMISPFIPSLIPKLHITNCLLLASELTLESPELSHKHLSTMLSGSFSFFFAFSDCFWFVILLE